MKCYCKYNPARDIKPVVQSGFIDLVQANRLSSVPSSINVEEKPYNGIEDPRSIGGRPSDVFDAMQMAKSIAGYKAPSSAASGESSEKTE